MSVPANNQVLTGIVEKVIPQSVTINGKRHIIYFNKQGTPYIHWSEKNGRPEGIKDSKVFLSRLPMEVKMDPENDALFYKSGKSKGKAKRLNLHKLKLEDCAQNQVDLQECQSSGGPEIATLKAQVAQCEQNLRTGTRSDTTEQATREAKIAQDLLAAVPSLPPSASSSVPGEGSPLAGAEQLVALSPTSPIASPTNLDKADTFTPTMPTLSGGIVPAVPAVPAVPSQASSTAATRPSAPPAKPGFFRGILDYLGNFGG